MENLPRLITDLALILGAAGLVTVIFKKLKQPLVLGYIVVGFFVGPHFSLFPSITENHNIETWSEIGVIFLLFSLGLEFSFKKLVKVGGASSVTALVKVIAMLGAGYITGQALGWSTMDSIFLGGILSISSTMITMRAFEELGIRGQNFTGMVLGILVIEDLVAIILLVLLSTIAVSQQFAGNDMIVSIFKLGFFLILCFVAGIFFLPTFLKRTKKLMNDETLLIVSLGLCLLMVVIAVEVGFSPALGAFIMGSILAETTMAEKIEHLIKPVKDLFGAIFFVSVGMLIEPDMLVKYAVPVLVISLVTIFGKFFTTLAGALLSGQPLKPSVQIGMSLAQIGEFSFIIATLGLSLKVTSSFLYPIAVAVSTITTLTTPYMIRLSEPLYIWLRKHLPSSFLRAVDRYSSGAQSIRSVSQWRKALRSFFINTIIFSTLIIAMMVLSEKYFVPFINERISRGFLQVLIGKGVTVLLMAPFIWALALRKMSASAIGNLWEQKKYRGPLIMLRLLQIGLAVSYIVFWLINSFSYTIAIAVIIPVLIFLGIFSKRIQHFYQKLEKRFLSNFYAREKLNNNPAEVPIVDQNQLTPWDAHMADFEIEPEWVHAGETLMELALREKLGINIAMIRRGNLLIKAPGRNEKIFPGDRVYVIGTDKQVARFKNFIAVNRVVPKDGELEKEMILKQMVIRENSFLFQKSIRDSGVREKTEGLIIGVERDGKRLLNPESTLVFEKGDVVWIVGNKALMAGI